MNQNRTQLKRALVKFFKTNSDFRKLKPQDQRFMTLAATEFVTRFSLKFIAGGVKHHDSDFLTETNFKGELTFELIDAWAYHIGDIWKRNNPTLTKAPAVKRKRIIKSTSTH